MTEREADRARPNSLRQRAVAALVSVGSGEISPDFRRRLEERDAAPSLFAAGELMAVARIGLEAEIARSIELDQRISSMDAICDALRRRGDGYAREQTAMDIADAAFAVAASCVRLPLMPLGFPLETTHLMSLGRTISPPARTDTGDG